MDFEPGRPEPLTVEQRGKRPRRMTEAEYIFGR